jgi:hypothetical protein
MSERREISLVLLLAGDAARMFNPPVSTESIRRWVLQGKLFSVAQLSDGTRLFFPSDVRRFIEKREKLTLTDPVLIVDNDDREHVLEPRDEDRP